MLSDPAFLGWFIPSITLALVAICLLGMAVRKGRLADRTYAAASFSGLAFPIERVTTPTPKPFPSPAVHRGGRATRRPAAAAPR